MPQKVLKYLLIISFCLNAIFSGTIPKPTGVAARPDEPRPITAAVHPSIDLDHFPARGIFTVLFNQPMNPTGSLNPVLVYPFTSGTAAWNENHTELRFTPETQYIGGQDYVFFLDEGLRSADGQRLTAPAYWDVTTLAGPQILDPYPLTGWTDTLRPTYRVRFDRAMNKESVASAFTVTPNIEYRLNWQASTLLITPEHILTPGIMHTFSISEQAEDMGGNSLTRAFTWTSGGRFSVDVEYIKKTPASIRLRFSNPINKGETQFPFEITPAVPGEWKWITDSSADYILEEPLPYGKVYTVHFTGRLIANTGEPLETPSAQISFTTPHPIINVRPRQEIGWFDDDDVIQITFEIPMDHDSVEKALRIQPDVPGVFEWQGNTLRYTPDFSSLPSNDDYFTVLISIETTALSAAGDQVFHQPYQLSYWYYRSFTDKDVSFGIFGDNIQVVHADGRRAIQFASGSDLPAYLTFSLYRYELGDYANLLANMYQTRRFGVDVFEIDDREAETTWEQAVHDEDKPNDFIQELWIPWRVEPGLFVLNVVQNGKVVDQLFVVLTRYALSVKLSDPDLFVWVSEGGGDQIPGAEIRLYSRRGEKLREGSSDDDGLYRTTVPPGYEPLFVVARMPDGDITIAGLPGLGRRTNGDYDWQIPRQNRQQYNLYIYTDRPIYKPGQEVAFKVIARNDFDIQYTLPEEGAIVTIEVQDRRANLLETQELALNSFGTAHSTYTLTESTMLGEYRLRAIMADSMGQVEFKVEDYRKPDYQVELSLPKDTYVYGEEVKITVDASYFFGKPVVGADVKSTLYRLDRKYYWGDGSYSSSYEPLESKGGPSGKIDEDGKIEISFDAPIESEPRFRDWSSSLAWDMWELEVRVDDGSGGLVAARVRFSVYNAPFKITLETGGTLHKPGQPLSLIARVVDLDGSPVSGYELNLDVLRYRNWSNPDDVLSPNQRLVTGSNGEARFEYTPLRSGYYEIQLMSVKTYKSKPVIRRWFYAYEREWYSRFDTSGIRIQALDEQYQPYRTGRFLIESTFSGEALLTFERGKVLHSQFIQLTAPITIIETNILPIDAPNVFVTVNTWEAVDNSLQEMRNSDKNLYLSGTLGDYLMRMDRIEIEVEQLVKPLEISMQFDSEIYAPSQTVSLSLQVTDQSGSAALAELSIAVIDEAIFSLSEPLNQPIFDAFFGKRGLSIYSYDSYSTIRYLIDNTGRGGGGDGSYAPPGTRSDFPDTLIWFPSVRTDTQGKATLQFELPDTLTTWRVTAYAVTRDTRVGEASITLLTQKDTVIQPLLPRLLIEGDTLSLGALVHNYSSQARTLEVRLLGSGLTIKAPATQTLALESGQVSLVSWQVEASTSGETLLLFHARDTLGSDAVELPLEIAPRVIPHEYSLTGVMTGSISLPLALPPNTHPNSVVQLRLNQTPAITLLEGAEYLVGYPYGCVEQTMSRALPNAVIGRAASQLGIAPDLLSMLQTNMLPASVQRLYNFQHIDGGWGWWSQDPSDVYQTAWVLFGLSLVEESGYPVEPRVLEDAVAYIQRQFSNDEALDLRTRTFALFSIAYAGYGDIEATLQAAERANELDGFSLAALALALDRLGEKMQAEQILKILENRMVQDSSGIHWPVSDYDEEYNHKTMASTVRTTALALSAFAILDPQNANIDQIAQFMLEKRQGRGWGTTNETAFAILGLTDWLLAKRSLSQPSIISVSLDGKEFLNGNLDNQTPVYSIDIPIIDLVGGAHTLAINNNSNSPVYFSLNQEIHLERQASYAKGEIEVERSYLDPRTKQPLKEVEFGQLVEVKLKFTLPKETWYLVMEDHVPGGLTALNERLNDNIRYETGTIYDADLTDFFVSYALDLGYNQKEIRGGRVTFFITRLEKGQHTITYLARATHAGQFIALPAEMYAMYKPELYGHSDSAVLLINPPQPAIAPSGEPVDESSSLR